MSKAPVKLCIDCKHHKALMYGAFSCCTKNFKGVEPNLVNGKAGELELALQARSCDSHRSYNWFDALIFNRCGKAARWFEPKKTWRDGSAVIS